MDRSTILPTLKKRYGFIHPRYLSKVKLGFSGNNFLLADEEEKYFVKRYRSGLSRDEIREIHSVKFFYRERGIPAILPLRDLNGSTFFMFEGHQYAVFPYVIGKFFTSLPSERAVASMANVLAEQHMLSMNHLSLLTKKKEFTGWDDDVFRKEQRRLIRRIQSTEEMTPFDRSTLAFIRDKATLAEQYAIKYEDLGLRNEYIIHGDFHTYNVFFSEDDIVSHVFDFERVMRGPRIIDLIYSMFLVCFNFSLMKGTEHAFEFDRARTFLISYHEQFPLEREEFRNGLMAYFLGELVHTHWVEAVYYFGGDTRVRRLLPERRRRLKYVANNYAAMEDRMLGWLF